MHVTTITAHLKLHKKNVSLSYLNRKKLKCNADASMVMEYFISALK